jgi:Putative motility protein
VCLIISTGATFKSSQMRRWKLWLSEFVNGFPLPLSGRECLPMDMMSMVSGLLAMQAGNTQSQIGAAILKSNADTEKATVLTLLGAAQQSSQANLAAGVGGNIDLTA